MTYAEMQAEPAKDYRILLFYCYVIYVLNHELLWFTIKIENMVPTAGVEPARVSPPPPQGGASTNFTTSACFVPTESTDTDKAHLLIRSQACSGIYPKDLLSSRNIALSRGS